MLQGLSPNSGSSSGLLDAPPPLPEPVTSGSSGGNARNRSSQVAPPRGSSGSILRIDPSRPSLNLPKGVTPVPAPLPLPIDPPQGESGSDGPLPPPPSALEIGPEAGLPPANLESGNGERVANDESEFLPYGFDEDF